LTLTDIVTLENSCIGNEAEKSMDIFEAIRTRRSIRKYKTDPVNKCTLFKVLEAVRLAPSAMNRQPYNLIVVTEPKTKEKLSSACNQNWVAPVMIVVCAFPEKSWVREDGEEYWKADAAIAMHSLSLTAVAEGLGTCWVAAFDEDRVKRILGVPSEVRVLAITPLGCPAEKKGPVTRRKSFEELVHYEKW
jgi:nitroreductase